MQDNQKTEVNSALCRGFTLLEMIAGSLRPLSAVEMGLALNLPRQSIHRILSQLEAMDLVKRDAGSERYVIAQRMRRLSLSCISTFQQTALTHRILQDLAAEIGETCNVGIIDGSEVVYIDRVECDWPLRLQLSPGSRVPIHCTAIGKLLLTYTESGLRQKILGAIKLTRLTERTITDPAYLEVACQEIKARGFALNNEEDVAGLVAIAVPVRDPSGHVVAGLATHAPTVRMTIKDVQGKLPLLKKVAEKLSTAMFR